MEAKGSVLIPIKKFIQESFGDEGVEKWLNSMSSSTKEVYGQENILASAWYPIEAYYEGDQKMRDVFFDGTDRGSYNCGYAVANYGLNSFYKLFIKFGSPKFLLNKASIIFSNYFRPSKMELTEINENNAIVKITEFPGLQDPVEIGVVTWAETALKASGCKNVNVSITKSITKGDEYSEIIINWE